MKILKIMKPRSMQFINLFFSLLLLSPFCFADKKLSIEVDHPLESEGLYRIGADGTYYYKEGPKPHRNSWNIHGGPYLPQNLFNPQNNYTFTEVYGNKAKPIIFADFFWKPFKHKNFSFLLGTGLMPASGNGRFSNNVVSDNEKFYLFTFPNRVGLDYAFKIFNTQILVPYINGGFKFFSFIEMPRSFKLDKIKIGNSTGSFFGGGLMINLSFLDRNAAAEMNADYGFKQTWLMVNYSSFTSFKEGLNFGADSISAGLRFDY